ncbi:MAG: hypothetical protein AAF348_07560 [Bacteroidota bacterium]
MKEQLIEFKTAKLAKEKGFDWPVRYYYQHNIEGKLITSDLEEELSNCNDTPNYPEWSRSTQSLLQKWLRKLHIDITVITNWLKDGKKIYYVGFSYLNKNNKIDIWFSKKSGNKIEYPTYEQALETALYEGLKII